MTSPPAGPGVARYRPTGSNRSRLGGCWLSAGIASVLVAAVVGVGLKHSPRIPFVDEHFVILNVSGAFHSRYMRKPSEEFADFLILSGQAAQIRVPVRVRQAAQVKYKIRIRWNAMLVAE